MMSSESTTKKSVLERQSQLYESLPLGTIERSTLRELTSPRTSHGGNPSKGKRKTPRPFTPKAPVHIVLKSKRAKGQWSLLHRKNKSKITSMVYVYAERFKVHVYRATTHGDQIHLLVRAQEKKNLQDYLRVLAGRVAITVTGARKGVKRLDPHPEHQKIMRELPGLQRKKFWDYLCWSRLVAWGKDFFKVSQSFQYENSSEPSLDEHSAPKTPESKDYRDFILRTRPKWAT